VLAAAVNIHVIAQAKPGLGLVDMSQKDFCLDFMDHGRIISQGVGDPKPPATLP
jgi:hypothetical protein